MLLGAGSSLSKRLISGFNCQVPVKSDFAAASTAPLIATIRTTMLKDRFINGFIELPESSSTSGRPECPVVGLRDWNASPQADSSEFAGIVRQGKQKPQKYRQHAAMPLRLER